MYKTYYVASLILLVSTVMHSYALTGPKDSVESIGFRYADYRRHDYAGGYIDMAQHIHRGNQQLFFLAEIAGGRISQSRGQNYDHVGLELGLEYRFLPVSRIAIAGSHDWFIGSPDYRIPAAHIRLYQALVPQDAPVTPFVRANGSMQFVNPVRESPARQDESYRLLVLEAIAGVKVRMRQDFSWVAEGGRSQSKAINNEGPDLADGWIARIAMRYEWF